MTGTGRKLLTIVTEAALERRLIDDFKRLGAQGYTIIDARGEGSRGLRNATWDECRNIRIEIVCDQPTADAITAYLQAHYYAHYGMILFLSDVTVLRPDKFR